MKKSKNNVKMGKIYLYSKLLKPPDKSNISKCHNDDEINFKIKFISEYIDDDNPSISFTAIVSFVAVLSNNGMYTKKGLQINDIYFKNEVNVLDSSRTNEYDNLYYNNQLLSNRTIFSNSSHSFGDGSFSSLINKGYEKKITNAIKEFFLSD